MTLVLIIAALFIGTGLVAFSVRNHVVERRRQKFIAHIDRIFKRLERKQALGITTSWRRGGGTSIYQD
jgi:hypothetical protein